MHHRASLVFSAALVATPALLALAPFARGAESPVAIKGGAPVAIASPKSEYTVATADLRLSLDKNGDLAGIVAGRKTWPVTGGTLLDGCTVQGAAKVERAGESVAFTRVFADKQGRRAEVTDTFAPNGKGGVRWTVAIKSDDAPWTCAITSRLNCADTRNTQFWTGWGSPDQSGADNLSPELMEKIAAGKAAVSASWSDPLTP